ncbi:MAG: hypothetical protein JO166_12380 [Deltaproteobacteria bacterium]|nr:hypothetical protein [Deltaproteobacteria bacterium]
MGRSRSYLAAKAIRAYVDLTKRQIAEIKAALNEADAGDFANEIIMERHTDPLIVCWPIPSVMGEQSTASTESLTTRLRLSTGWHATEVTDANYLPIAVTIGVTKAISESNGQINVVDRCSLRIKMKSHQGPSVVWFIGITAMLGLFSNCSLFRHQPAGHISVKAVSWKLVKKYAEPEAGLAGHKVTIINRLNGRVVAEKSTDNLGYAIFDVPAGNYTIKGVGDESQNVVVSPGQTVGFKLIVH